MKILQQLSFLIRRHPLLSRSSLPLPSLFNRTYLTPLSVAQSNRTFRTLDHSTTTSSNEAPPETNSNQNVEETPISEVEDKTTSEDRPRLVNSVKTPSLPKPVYILQFTCKPCGCNSKHRISKQGYHHGTVLVTCPACNNRHVISDHLKIFLDKYLTIEDILRQKGETLQRGTINSEGDVEFLQDPSEVSNVNELTEKDKIVRLMKDVGNRGQKIDALFEDTMRLHGIDMKRGPSR